VPESIKEGRFANWLRDARDWNLSRSRYWGTPIPVWQSEDGEESVCIGSIAELEKLTGEKVTDLHRESVDKLTIPSARPGMPPLRRITEVFDCWFESGSMPYAQLHYPFENKKEFDETFPADFIAEGTDQTRGWFYTLLVLSTALFNKPPYKNLIVNGLVLAADGQKMSKSKKNYPDPNLVMDKYGADALRLFLINSPVVKAESLKFKEEGVRDILKDVFLPWYNAFRFLMQNIDAYQKREDGEQYLWAEEESLGQSDNVMDRWIVSFTQSLLVFVKKEMAGYRLYTVLPRLMKFIDNLTNWYVRMNRKRLKGEGNSSKDCRAALDSLFSVLFTMVRVFAPFTPFLTETMYQRIKDMVKGHGKDKDKASVHYLMIPQPRNDLINEDIERSVAKMQAAINLGRIIRDRRTMPVKYPLPELVLIHKDQQCLDDVAALQGYILNELNVKKLTLSSDKKAYGVILRAEPNFRELGARLKNEFKAVTAEIKKLDDSQLEKFLKESNMKVLGHKLGEDDVRVMYTFAEKSDKFETDSDNDILVLLDCTPDQSMLDEGISREVINRVQKLRKKAALVPSDEVTVWYDAGNDLSRVIEQFKESIETTTKSPIRPTVSKSGAGKEIARESYDMKGANMELVITVGFCSDFSSQPAVALEVEDNGAPPTKFVNVVCDGRVGVVLLENPVGCNVINGCGELVAEVNNLFGDQGLSLYDGDSELKSSAKAVTLSGKTVYARKDAGGQQTKVNGLTGSSCKFATVESAKGANGTLLLENPRSCDLSRFAGQAAKVAFGSKDGAFYTDKERKNKAERVKNGQTVYVGI
jgi:isoleucyl-tRNA synthetase